MRPVEAYSDYGFIAVLALTQRLIIDLLPMTWQVRLGSLGRGGISYRMSAVSAHPQSMRTSRKNTSAQPEALELYCKNMARMKN